MGLRGEGGGGRFGMVIELHILGAHIRDGFYTGGRINGIWLYFVKVFKLMTSLLSLFLVFLDQLVFPCYSFFFSTCLHFVIVMVYNFTIGSLKLKYVLS